jgi:hypothetical protein
MKQMLRVLALSGFAALGCETDSSQSEVTSYRDRPTQIRVVAPDGRTLFGSTAMVQVYPSLRNVRPDTFTLVASAETADPKGGFRVGITQPAESVDPSLIDLPISDGRIAGGPEFKAVVSNENGAVPSGRVRVQLRDGHLTGTVDTPDGTYKIEGSVALECYKPEGDNSVVDETNETLLCRRFASMFPE